MNKKIILVLVLSLLLPNLTVGVLAADTSENEFYSSLQEKEYKEYAHANLNVRKKVLGKDLDEVSKSLGKYSFGDLADFPANKEFYFFASALEDKHSIIKKYVIYDVNGKRIEAGINRHAKKESVMKNEFNGWETAIGEDELSNKRE